MYSARSFELTRNEYNYLLPVLRTKLLCTNDKFYFIDKGDDLSDMLERLCGLYEKFNEGWLSSTLVYHCFINRSLSLFRSELKVYNFLVN